MAEQDDVKPAPADVATAWAMTLIEPLLPDRLRFSLEDAMTKVCRRHPSWAAAFFGGSIAHLVRTLPEGDPWRLLAARIGDMATGGQPPPENGAVSLSGPRAGHPFGTWHDGEDLSPLVFADPEHDVALAALSQPLSPVSAALIAFAGDGWKTCIQAIRASYTGSIPNGDEPDEDSSDTPSNVAYPDRWRTGAAGVQLYRTCSDALKWAVWRRRAHGVAEDMFVAETAFRWSWRADKIILGEPWSTADIDREIAADKIEDPGARDDDF